MKRHTNKDRGLMGGMLLLVLGVFFMIHVNAPDIKLWPYLLVAIGALSMVARRHRTTNDQAGAEGAPTNSSPEHA